MRIKNYQLQIVCVLCVLCVSAVAQPQRSELPLPSGQVLLTPAPGAPRPLNTLPVTIAASPDHKHLAVLNCGYGAEESKFAQSIAIVDLATNAITDFPDARFGPKAHQTYFLGLAFSGDGTRLYASVASITDPEGRQPGDLGNGIAVYAFDAGRLVPDRFIKIPLQALAPGKRSNPVSKHLPPERAVPYPAGLAVIPARGSESEKLLVADNLSDDALLIDPATGAILKRFDLSVTDTVPAAFPYAVIVAPDATRAWVSLWNASRIAELDLATGRVARHIALHPPKLATQAGSHPTAMLLDAERSTLYVALANTDEVAVVDIGLGKLKQLLSTKLPGQQYAGAYPNALAQTPDGQRLFVANASSDAIAVFDVTAVRRICAGECKWRSGFQSAKLLGFVPSEWYPAALALAGDDLFIASAKGRGAGPNPPPGGARAFIATLLHGSLARVNLSAAEARLPELTREVLAANRMEGNADHISFLRGGNPIKHVVYVIKENRTYDQVFGDLPQGNGDPSLCMYGEDITPNQHKLARQFGIIDNFYDSGDVSNNGHVWSTAAITSDYTEKTWPVALRGAREHTYDYEGNVANANPLAQGIADVNEPGTGYLWSNIARHKLTYRHYGEFITSFWCDKSGLADLLAKPRPQVECRVARVPKGERLPNGLFSPYEWPIPLLATNIATKPELLGHFAPTFPDYRVDFPDQLRADEFLKEFDGFVVARRHGDKRRQLPAFVLIRLPNDHTAGTRPHMPRPTAAVADNDLALGRMVQAISQSAYWKDTAIFVLEDDAQNGADHVDAHRSLALVISKYAPGSPPQPFVDHRFYTTVNLIRTMEVLLGLPPMNNNDARAALMSPLFSGPGTQPPFLADYRNQDNGLIYQANPEDAPDAKASLQLDFSTADAADTAILNAILWRDRMGDRPMPAPVYNVTGK